MPIRQLVRTFASREQGPIDIDTDVVPAVLALAEGGEVYCWGNKALDPAILKGLFRHWTYPPNDRGDPEISVYDIDYATNAHIYMQRLVCCKELMHILDPVDCRVMTNPEFEILCKKIVLPPETQDPLRDGKGAMSDRIASLYALAILFPWAMRQLILPKYESGVLTIEKITEIIQIPPGYIQFVMSDEWPEVHKYFVD